MRRIKIVEGKMDGATKKALSALLAEAGFTPDEIEIIAAVGEPEPDCDDEIILVLASLETCADAELEKELVAAQSGGRRAICVWPLDASPTAEPPAAVLKYAYSVIPWNADKLRAVAADDDALCFEKPDGQALPTPETERNLCVDEKATLK